jgi:hypothetical protein
VSGAADGRSGDRYDVVDAAPLPGRSYYRLRQRTVEGGDIVGDVVSVTMDPPQLLAYPNPVSQLVNISGPRGAGRLRLYDGRGTLVRQLEWPGGHCTLDIGDLAAGRYTALLTVSGTVHRVEVIKR